MFGWQISISKKFVVCMIHIVTRAQIPISHPYTTNPIVGANFLRIYSPSFSIFGSCLDTEIILNLFHVQDGVSEAVKILREEIGPAL